MACLCSRTTVRPAPRGSSTRWSRSARIGTCVTSRTRAPGTGGRHASRDGPWPAVSSMSSLSPTRSDMTVLFDRRFRGRPPLDRVRGAPARPRDRGRRDRFAGAGRCRGPRLERRDGPRKRGRVCGGAGGRRRAQGLSRGVRGAAASRVQRPDRHAARRSRLRRGPAGRTDSSPWLTASGWPSVSPPTPGFAPTTGTCLSSCRDTARSSRPCSGTTDSRTRHQNRPWGANSSISAGSLRQCRIAPRGGARSCARGILTP
jgi:hypothetical protein